MDEIIVGKLYKKRDRVRDDPLYITLYPEYILLVAAISGSQINGEDYYQYLFEELDKPDIKRPISKITLSQVFEPIFPNNWGLAFTGIINMDNPKFGRIYKNKTYNSYIILLDYDSNGYINVQHVSNGNYGWITYQQFCHEWDLVTDEQY